MESDTQILRDLRNWAKGQNKFTRVLAYHHNAFKGLTAFVYREFGKASVGVGVLYPDGRTVSRKAFGKFEQLLPELYRYSSKGPECTGVFKQ